jgi:molybdopterin converting factor small subunit
MRVTVQLPQMLRASADGAATVEIDIQGSATLGAVLDALAARHPKLERRLRDEQRGLRRYVNFYLDGEECRGLDGPETTVSEGTEIRVVPSVAGG